MLTDSQRATLPLGWFEVRGSMGGHYRIYTNSTVQNIRQPVLAGSKEFCVTLDGAEHRQEVWLAQKILIESDEMMFKRIAVITYCREFGYNR
jgi:hypothetical protein